MKKYFVFIMVMALFLISGCQKEQQVDQGEKIETKTVKVYKGEVNEPINLVPTTKPYISLTFNGMGDEQFTTQLLEELAQQKIKATFFLPAMRVAENPEIAKKIQDAGHEIESNLLNDIDYEQLSYTALYKEVSLANQVFEEHLGITPQFVRTRSGEVNKDLLKIVAQLNMKRAVEAFINPLDRNMQGAEEIANYVNKYVTRGSVIMLNNGINPAVIEAIPLIADNAKQYQYEFVTIEQLNQELGEIINPNDIESYNDIKVNANYENVTPRIFTTADVEQKEIALTFDDWASEHTIINILDILDKYQIKSTFFLIGKGVEQNPALAKLIVERGHEVASHSYYHKNVTTMTTQEVQEDVVKAHKAITNAIQQKPKLYFRPAEGIMTNEIAKMIIATGYEVVALYDIASFDWNPELTTNEIVERVMTRAKPGSVVVMHIMDNRKTAEALPIIIEKLTAEGYDFKKMSDWIESEVQ